MNEELFWHVIGLFDWNKACDNEFVIEPAVGALCAMAADDILGFEDMLAAKLYALDTRSHANQAGEQPYVADEQFSEDWFLYQRCCVVANGRVVYDSVVSDPRNMPKGMVFEALLSVAATAYVRKTGMPFDHVTPVSYDTCSNAAGWDGRAASPAA